ncbi:sensor histidine kinase [Veronia pacifica]
MVDYGQGVVAYVCYMMILVFIVGLVSANLISKHFTAPILSLIEQVERSSGDNIQMPGTNRRDEIGELHRAFYQSFSRIQAFLHREKQFTRFSSHELRTPVHVIGGSVQLLEMCENDKKRLEIIKRISGANRDMEQLINTFLFIGREQKNRQPEVRLSDTLRDCIEEHKYLLSDRDVNIECHSSSDEMVKMYFAKVIVANLVRNAFNYAKSKVVVTLSARRLLIENDITSDAEAGFGHGKHIIDEICKVEKWHYYASIKPYKALVVIYF